MPGWYEYMQDKPSLENSEGSWSSRASCGLGWGCYWALYLLHSLAAHLLPCLSFPRTWSQRYSLRIMLHTRSHLRISSQEIQPTTGAGGWLPFTLILVSGCSRGPLESLNLCLLDLGNIMDSGLSCQRKLRSTGSKAERGKGKERRRRKVQGGGWVTVRRGRQVSEEDSTQSNEALQATGQQWRIRFRVTPAPITWQQMLKYWGWKKSFCLHWDLMRKMLKLISTSLQLRKGGTGAYICHLYRRLIKKMSPINY